MIMVRIMIKTTKMVTDVENKGPMMTEIHELMIITVVRSLDHQAEIFFNVKAEREEQRELDNENSLEDNSNSTPNSNITGKNN